MQQMRTRVLTWLVLAGAGLAAGAPVAHAAANPPMPLAVPRTESLGAGV
jgi:hypothetical protein